MKKIILSFLLSTLFFNNGNAVSLYQALNETYKNNTQLNAERENINAAEEDINISKADYMPSLSLSGSKSFENTNELTTQSGTDTSIDDVNPLSSSIKLEQKLFDQGRDFTHQKNIVGLELAKARLVKKEQDILYSAIDAFTGLILAREKLNINRRNLNLLIRQVETDKVRLDRGQITITDLSQSESSLAGAQAQFTQSKSDLLISKLNYENIIGNIDDPSKLKKSSNSIVKIPENLSKAVSLSKENNPDIKISTIKEGHFAVIQYSGRASDNNFLKHRDILNQKLLEDNININGPAIRATYNGPFTLPMMRRNEVMFKVSWNK